MSSKGIIFYTDSRLDPKIAQAVQTQLNTIDLPAVSVSLNKPTEVRGMNMVLEAERGYLTMFRQILTALHMSKQDIVFFCEHDCLYPKEHFDFTPTENKFYYDLNWWKVREDGLAVHWDAVQVSGLACYRDLAIKWYTDRIETFDKDNFDRKFEPTIDTQYETWRSPTPMIDIRHNHNLTYNKWKLDHFRKKETAINFEESTVDKILGWSNLSAII